MLPKRLIALTLFATLAVMPTCVLRAQWVQTNGPYGGNISALAICEGRIIAAGNGVVGSDDNGNSWFPMDSVPVGNGTFVVNGATIYAINGNLYRSTDKGNTWTSLGLSNVNSLDVSGQALLAGGCCINDDPPQGSVQFSSDNGGHWIDVIGNSGDFSGYSTVVNSVAFVGTKLIVSTEPYTYGLPQRQYVNVPGGVFTSSDTGRYWNMVYGDPIGGIAVMGNKVFGVNSHGPLLSSGKGWNLITTWPSNLPVTTLAVVGPNLFAGTDGSGIFRSTDSGVTWLPTDSVLVCKNIYCISANGNIIYASTSDGLFRSTDNGTTWKPVGITWSSGYSFVVAGPNLIAANYGNFCLTSNNGDQWKYIGGGLGQWSYVLQWSREFISIGSILLVSTGNGLMRSSDNGVTWATDSLKTAWGHFCVSNSSVYLANAQELYLSTDSGLTWSTVDTGIGLNRSLSAVSVNGSNIFIGDEYQRVFRSTDSGKDWTQVHDIKDGSDYYGVISLFFVGENIFATDNGNVYESNDSGESWTRVQGSINCYAVDGNKLFVGRDSGVFLTTDYGSHWTPVNTGLPSLSIEGLAVSGQYLFASTAGAGVWRRLLSETDPSVEGETFPLAAYPNPFTSTTTIRYTINGNTQVSMLVYDALGRIVNVLASNEFEYSGTHEIDFNSYGLQPGVYWCRLTSDAGDGVLKLLVSPQ